MRTKFDIYVFILVHINKKIVLKNVETPLSPFVLIYDRKA